MRLSDVDIEFYRRTGHLDITPWDDDSLQAASYDLHLGCYVRIPDLYFQENRNGIIFNEIEWREEKFHEHDGGRLAYVLPPNAFRLFSTVEVITVSGHLAAAVAGKSSRARDGIAVEFAGWVDPGFTDGQITFEQLRTPTQRPYSKTGHYNGQRGPTQSWIGMKSSG